MIGEQTQSQVVDTGLPWIPRCPNRWTLKRLKYLVDERSEKGYPDEPLLTASQSRGVIAKADYGSRTVEAQKDLHLLKLVEPGDYVISLRSFQGGIEYAHVRGIISPAYTVLQPKTDVRRGYYQHFFKSADFINSMSLFVTGIREGQNIDYVRLSRAYMPFPPPEEQNAIGRFIRHLDHRVNRLIKTKRRLIELLNEQKQAIIHRAVTRGLDPSVPLKPSGIEWIGEIPVAWNIRRVKQLSTILRGKFSHRPRNEPTLYDGEYPFIQTGEVARAGKVIQGFRQTLNEKGLAVSKMFPAGTLVMTIAANIGEVAVLDFNACFPDSIVGFVPKPVVQRDFLYYAFVAMKEELLREAPINTQGNLNVDRIGCRELALPPISEQEVLVHYIEESTEDLDRTIQTAKSEIDLIREYRTRLVADVVTGQLDVRHFDLPEVEDLLTEAVDVGLGDCSEPQDEEAEN